MLPENVLKIFTGTYQIIIIMGFFSFLKGFFLFFVGFSVVIFFDF